jgi:hypothetical protein
MYAYPRLKNTRHDTWVALKVTRHDTWVALKDTRHDTWVAQVGPSKEKMKAEREQLVSLVKLQAREMEALKAEINMLRRKGGHVYTPSVRRGGGTQ